MGNNNNLILAWIGHVTGTISFASSSSMIYMIVSDRERRLVKSNHRLMLGLSIFDCFQSAAYAMTTIAVPTEYSIGTYGNIGNSTTCKAQAFFLVLGHAVPMYNASLCILYLLTIRHGVTFTKFSTNVEPFLHIASVLIPFTIATLTVAMGKTSPGPTVCYVSYYPDHALLLLITAIVIACGIICVYSLSSICYTVNQRQRRMSIYSFSTATRMKSRYMETRATIIQALLYTSAFIITFLFPCVAYFYPETFWLEVLSKTFYPLQGLWNFLLYIRPGVAKLKKDYPDKDLLKILYEVVFHANDSNAQVRHGHHSNRPSAASHNKAQSKDTDFKPRLIQNNSLKCDSLSLHSGFSGHISVEENESHDRGESHHDPVQVGTRTGATVVTYDLSSYSHNSPPIDVLEILDADADGDDIAHNGVHFNDKLDVLEAGNFPQISSQFMKKEDLEIENTNTYNGRAKRRTSLVNLATNLSLYDLDSLSPDSVDSVEVAVIEPKGNPLASNDLKLRSAEVTSDKTSDIKESNGNPLASDHLELRIGTRGDNLEIVSHNLLHA